MHDGAMVAAVIAADCLNVCSAITGGCGGGDSGGDGGGVADSKAGMDDDDSPPKSVSKRPCCFLFLSSVASK